MGRHWRLSAYVNLGTRYSGVRAVRDAAQDLLRGLRDILAEISTRTGSARLVLVAPLVDRPHRRVPHRARGHPGGRAGAEHIRTAIEFERHMMDGNYAYLTQNVKRPQYFSFFMDQLMETVRSKVAIAMEKSYTEFST